MISAYEIAWIIIVKDPREKKFFLLSSWGHLENQDWIFWIGKDGFSVVNVFPRKQGWDLCCWSIAGEARMGLGCWCILGEANLGSLNSWCIPGEARLSSLLLIYSRRSKNGVSVVDVYPDKQGCVLCCWCIPGEERMGFLFWSWCIPGCSWSIPGDEVRMGSLQLIHTRRSTDGFFVIDIYSEKQGWVLCSWSIPGEARMGSLQLYTRREEGWILCT